MEEIPGQAFSYGMPGLLKILGKKVPYRKSKCCFDSFQRQQGRARGLSSSLRAPRNKTSWTTHCCNLDHFLSGSMEHFFGMQSWCVCLRKSWPYCGCLSVVQARSFRSKSYAKMPGMVSMFRTKVSLVASLPCGRTWASRIAFKPFINGGIDCSFQSTASLLPPAQDRPLNHFEDARASAGLSGI